MNPKLSYVLIALLKGVIYQDKHPGLWQDLLNLQATIREHFNIIGLLLFIDEAEGYAFLKQQPEQESLPELPTLISRRALGYHLSLLCVLLRKKLLEHDASGGETRVILSHDHIVDMMKIFLSDRNNEVKIHDQIAICINKMIDMGFLRKLKVMNEKDEKRYEICRIIKAFVDANWLSDIDHKLKEYENYEQSGV